MQRELDADGEEQEDDPDVGEGGDALGLAYDPRREGADHDAREDVAHDRRQPDPVRDLRQRWPEVERMLAHKALRELGVAVGGGHD